MWMNRRAPIIGFPVAVILLAMFWCSTALAFSCSVTGTIEIQGQSARGLACDAGTIWATFMPGRDTDHCVIYKFDAATNQVVGQSAQFHWNGRSICAGNGFLWVTDALADRIHVLDPATLQEVRSFATPGSEPCGIAFDGSSLWLNDPWSGGCFHLDLNGQVLGVFPIPNVYREGLEWHDGLLYTNPALTTVSAYTTGGQLAETYDLGCLPAGARVLDLTFSGALLYVSDDIDGKIRILAVAPIATEIASWSGLKNLYR